MVESLLNYKYNGCYFVSHMKIYRSDLQKSVKYVDQRVGKMIAFRSDFIYDVSMLAFNAAVNVLRQDKTEKTRACFLMCLIRELKI